MGIRIKNYKYGYKIVSLAVDEATRDNLVGKGLDTLFISNDYIVLYPENVIISKDLETIEHIKTYNNFDVLEIWDNGFLNRRYNDKSNENYFFITGSCNSNCIMCPSPETTRKNVQDVDMNSLMKLAKHIPSDTPHLTITGGEPFIIGEKIYPFINFLKEKFTNTEFLFLTNGRIFAVDKFLHLFKQTIPNYSVVAIPIHGSCSEVHDAITRTKGSFEQTKIGIKKLLNNKIAVELRIVINKLNITDFDNIARLIINDLKGIQYISIIAMEMTGNARVNKEQVWIPYRESFSVISPSIRKIIENGIDVRLYNFPLCTVDSSFWTLCEKSISTEKIRYDETCESCRYKKNCGGIFAGTFQLERNELKAIL